MWKKILAVIFIFYFFALLQNSFLVHFNLFGAVPDLVFISFFLLVFFDEKKSNYEILFLAAVAGLLLDFFSFTYLGPSIAILIIIGFGLNWVQSMLKNNDDEKPFAYYLPLFVVFFLIYQVLFAGYAYYLDPNKINVGLGMETVFSVIYNSVIASVFFYVYKWQKTIRSKM